MKWMDQGWKSCENTTWFTVLPKTKLKWCICWPEKTQTRSIPASFSFGGLCISRKQMQAILRRYRVSADFASVILAFGEPPRISEQGYECFARDLQSDGSYGKWYSHTLNQPAYIDRFELIWYFRIILSVPVRGAWQPRLGLEVSSNRRLLCVWASFRLVSVYLLAASPRKQIRCQARCLPV
jgi:hypothetical protein